MILKKLTNIMIIVAVSIFVMAFGTFQAFARGPSGRNINSNGASGSPVYNGGTQWRALGNNQMVAPGSFLSGDKPVQPKNPPPKPHHTDYKEVAPDFMRTPLFLNK